MKAQGYKVISTRDHDDYVDNLARAELANKKRARVLISIHGNALEEDSSTKGIQVLYYPGRSRTEKINCTESNKDASHNN